MKLTVLKLCSALSIIAVFASIFAIYVHSEKIERAELWVSTYEEYSQAIDVSKHDFFNVDVFDMEEMISKQQTYKIYSFVAVVSSTLFCIFLHFVYLRELKKYKPLNTNNKFKIKTILLKLLTLLGFVGTNVGTYMLYKRYILFKTPDETIQESLAHVYSPLSEYEAMQLENENTFHFLISLIIVSSLICVISFIINRIRLKRTRV